jgi:hypothetical protein
MNNSLKIVSLGLITALSVIPNHAYATGKAAGLPCTSPVPPAPPMIETSPSDNFDDLIACVGGTWRSMIYGGSPRGAIQSFNLAACPSGWSPIPQLAGRTIIGAGAGENLTPRAAGTFGGEETHQLQITELPKFQVTFTFGASDKGGRGNGFAYSDDAGGASVRAVYNKTSNTIGNGQPFNLMMPYVALLYCMKQ